ncbi:MAG: hypothetical protein PVJ39_06110 [Gammaproteobacteria bacterium]|jgi:hypothetical protein
MNLQRLRRAAAVDNDLPGRPALHENIRQITNKLIIFNKLNYPQSPLLSHMRSPGVKRFQRVFGT